MDVEGCFWYLFIGWWVCAAIVVSDDSKTRHVEETLVFPVMMLVWPVALLCVCLGWLYNKATRGAREC